MAEKKKARWEENRELIQLRFADLDKKYKNLKTLVDALCEMDTTFIKETMLTGPARVRRPNQIKNMIKEIEKMKG